MDIKFYKKVVALTAGVSVLASPLPSLAEQQAHQQVSIQKQPNADQPQDPDEQALKNIEASFEGVDGRGGGTVDNKKTDSLQHSEGIYEETGTLTVPSNSNRTKRSLSAASTKKINGVPFTEWIVPVGNDAIRPQNHMSPKYITIHETANTSVGAGARNHAQYLYNQAVGKTDRGASWHFTVDDKEIYQHLPLNENGWHASDGNGPGNRESIAIEIAVNKDGNYSKAVDNAKKLVAYLMKETGVQLNNITTHQRWDKKNHKKCPGIMLSTGQWDAFVNGVKSYYNNFHQPTDDITGGWYESAIRELNRRGIMAGEGNGVFAPNRAVTRAEFAQLISKSLNLPAGDASFKDLNDANPTLRDGIKSTASVGIISGRGDGYFDPNTPITREEAGVIVNKALQYKGINGPVANLPFADKDQIIYKEAVQRLYGLGIVKGIGDNLYAPKGTTTRGESAVFLLNMLQIMETGSPQQVIGTIQINGIGVNIRNGAGKNYSVIRKATKGEKANVYEEKNGWLRISTKEWVYYESIYINYNK